MSRERSSEQGPRWDDREVEVPEADVAEQEAELAGSPPDEGGEEPDGPGGASLSQEVPFDVNEADAAEQRRVVELDEDDYR